MNKRTKALAIPKSVKEAVFIRDGGRCILCGSPLGHPDAHVVRRSQGGKGIERNIVTLCPMCHRAYDEGSNLWRFGKGATRESLYCHIVAHLKGFYPDWNREDMIYRKGEND
jgi:uncharacterized protein with PIN domain